MEFCGVDGDAKLARDRLVRRAIGQERQHVKLPRGQLDIGSITRLALVSPESGAVEADAGLTPREAEVLALLAEGASNKVIARRLGISIHTAKFHVGSILDKLDATGRTDAVAHAARRGVIHL